MTRQEQHNHLYSLLQLGLHDLDPVVCPHGWLDLDHLWLGLVVAASVKALLHGALKLIGSLSIPVTVEDGPVLELDLGEHLALNLTVDLTSALLDVETVRSTACVGTHQQVASGVLETLELLRILVELQMPECLLLLALLVGLEVMHEILDLLDLGLSVGVHNLGQVLHQSEVGTHGISQTCQLTQLWDEGDFESGSPVLVDQQWLVGILDGLVVASLVVLHVAGLGALLVKCGLWGLCEIDPVDLVGLLVIGRHDSRSRETLLHCVVAILVALLRVVPHVLHELEH